MSMKLRDLIRAVRACKTAAEERAVVTKESALIRTAFKDEAAGAEYRHRNVAKLLYLNILGYPTHFGQMECIKLLASGRFNEKRIGYLALMLLLDEKQEVLTLVTNSLQLDLNHGNHFVAGLALTALGTIGSAEMARDLANDVDKHLKGDNPFLRKKAALCTIRLLRRVPDLVDVFLPRIVVLLTDKNHNVLLCAVTLITALVGIAPGYAEKFGRIVPALLKILRKLQMSTASAPEYDIGGVCDPFLQTKIVHLLGVLGRASPDAAAAMAPVLAQVASNTEGGRNAGCAVLYETAATIMTIAAGSASSADGSADGGGKEGDASLRALAVTILGRFLGAKDPNHRYVALDTLTRVITQDVAAVQRHRAVIVECLRDSDVSIRRRALDLVYGLVNAENVRPLTRELLNYLAVADAETKPDLCVKIAAVADRYAPSRRWHIDTLIALLAAGGDTAKRPVVSTALFLIAHGAPEEHAALTHKLFAMAQALLAAGPGAAEHSQQLLQAAIWCAGEFAPLLLAAPPSPPPEDSIGPVGEARSEGEAVRLLEKALHVFGATADTKAMVLTALLKIVVKLDPSGGGAAPTASAAAAAAPGSAEAALGRAKRIIASFAGSTELELQARAVEFSAIADPYGRLRPAAGAGAATAASPSADGDLMGLGDALASAAAPAAGGAGSAAPIVAAHRAELLAPIPLLEPAIMRARAAPAGIVAGDLAAAALEGAEVAMAVAARGSTAAAAAAASAAVGGAGAASAGAASAPDLLGDLSDLLGGLGGAPAPAAAATATPATTAGGKKAGGAGAAAAGGVDLDALFSTVATSGAGDLLSNGSAPTPAPAVHAAAAHAGSSAAGGIGDLFAPSPAPVAAPASTAFSPAMAAAATAKPAVAPGGGVGSLDDLLSSSLSGLSGLGSAASPAPAPAPKPLSAMVAATTAAPAASVGGLDALFGGGGSAAPAAAGGLGGMGLGLGGLSGGTGAAAQPASFGGFVAPPAAPAASSVSLPHTFAGYDGPHLAATFRCDKPGNSAASPLTDVTAVFRLKGGVAGASGFVCQVAPPKYVKMTLMPASGNVLSPGGEVSQVIKLENSLHGAKPLMLKLKLSYTITSTGEAVTEVVDVKGFPATL